VPRGGSVAARWGRARSVVSTGAADVIDNPSGFAFVSIFREAFLASKSPLRVHQNAIGLQAHPAELRQFYRLGLSNPGVASQKWNIMSQTRHDNLVRRIGVYKLYTERIIAYKHWSGREDSNLRPPGPEL
jgi:hypothetical protein